MQNKTAKLLQHVVLKPHQEKGVNKADKSNGQVLLDWEPGEGKTLGSEAIVEDLREKGRAVNTLVLAPAQLKDNYLKNLKQFTDAKGIILTSKNDVNKTERFHIGSEIPPANYYITSNELFRKDPEGYINKTKADTIILDEVQKYRDPNSQNYKQMMSVRPLVKNVIALTGTPISNSPKDIIPILDIVTNKKHGLGEYKDFDKTYVEKKEVRKGPLSFIGIGVKGTEVKLKNTGKLQNELQKYVSSHHELSPDKPKKDVEEINVPMSKEQKNIYDYVLKSSMNPLTRLKVKYNMPVDSKEAQHIFTAILKARQASNSIHLFDKNVTPEIAAEMTPKAKRLLDDVEQHLKESPENKAIVYTNFYHGGIDILSAGLNKKGIKHGVYAGSGKVNTDIRANDVKKYLSGEHRVQLINSAGAEGLDLPGTTGHFAFDGHFNPAMIHQSEGRGIRLGSPVDKVLVKRYKSVVPANWFETKLGIQDWEPLKIIRGYSTDEWVYSTAKRKERLNNQMQDLMKSGSFNPNKLVEIIQKERVDRLFNKMLKNEPHLSQWRKIKSEDEEKKFFQSTHSHAQDILRAKDNQNMLLAGTMAAVGIPLAIKAIRENKSPIKPIEEIVNPNIPHPTIPLLTNQKSVIPETIKPVNIESEGMNPFIVNLLDPMVLTGTFAAGIGASAIYNKLKADSTRRKKKYALEK